MHVLYSFPHRIGSPGIGTTAWHQVDGLLRAGVRVTLVAASVERGFESAPRTLRTGHVLGLRVPQRLVGVDRAKAWHDARVARLVQREEFDLVHVWPGAALRTLDAAEARRVPSLLERPSAHTREVYAITARVCDGLGVSLPSAHYARYDATRLAREEREFAAADRLLCPSDFVVRTFLEAGFSQERLLRHRYGYDPARHAAAGAPGERPFTCLYVGDCYPLKGLHVALSAWYAAGLDQVGRFLICGRFDPSYRQLLARDLAHPSIVELGFVHDVGAVMEEADVLVHPSFAEGSALVTYEARGSGLVLAVSSAAGAVVQPGVDGLVHEPGDVSGLAGHLLRLASDPHFRMRLRDASLATVRSLTWSAAARELVTVYERAVVASGSASSHTTVMEKT